MNQNKMSDNRPKALIYVVLAVIVAEVLLLRRYLARSVQYCRASLNGMSVYWRIDVRVLLCLCIRDNNIPVSLLSAVVLPCPIRNIKLKHTYK